MLAKATASLAARAEVQQGDEPMISGAICGHVCAKVRRVFAAVLAAVLAIVALALCSAAVAADIAGEWTSDGNYVFRFEQRGDGIVGSVVQPSTGRRFALADIVVEGARVVFFVVHEADWDEEVKQNGGKPFRNTAEGTLTDTELALHGSREGTNLRAYQTVLKRVAAHPRVERAAPPR
jgi:hypothetical protein